MNDPVLYHLCRAVEWAAAAPGSAWFPPAARQEGFLHLSTAAQVAGSAERHFRDRGDVVLVSVDAGRLGPDLRWEPSRGGDLFPHLYGPLPLAAVLAVTPLVTGPEGFPQVPALDGRAAPEQTPPTETA